MSNQDEQDTIFPSLEHRTVLVAALKMHGVASINVNFNGEGDSGALEEPEFYTVDRALVNLDEQQLEWVETSSSWRNGEWFTSTHTAMRSIPDIVRDVAYAALSLSRYDWYNNNGGYGSFNIDLEEMPPKITLDMHLRTVVTDDYEIGFDIRTGHKEAEIYMGRSTD